MNKREYLKYNNPEAYDLLGNPIKPKDIVIINAQYGTVPIIGMVDHFTETGGLAIKYIYNRYKSDILCWAYRPSRKVIKYDSKNGNIHKFKDKIEGKS